MTVTISTIKPEEFAKRNFIGYRRVQQSESEEESEKEDVEATAKEVPGMEMTKSKKPKESTGKSFEKLTENLKSEKDVKKLVSWKLDIDRDKLSIPFISDQADSEDRNEEKQNYQNAEW